mmetsp:Transcript_132447/g.247706  ORF Transcript_132447/g.247706 Transcript_132447/m.247706 type:complete len:299 (+) Transcript_132447:32-928(+)
MSELPPLPNVFAIGPGLESAALTRTSAKLGYELGKNLIIWDTSEHVVDFVAEGGFRRACDNLSSSLQKWMAETPPPHVLMCGSRGGRVLSRLIAEGKAIPPCLVLNSMLYYLFVPEDLFDKLQFNIAIEVGDVLLTGAAKHTSPIPASVAPRTVLAASPGDGYADWRFMPDELLRPLAQRLNDCHVYYNERDDHNFGSVIRNAENLSALLRLAAHGNPDEISATRGVVDSCLRKGAEVCGLPGPCSEKPQDTIMENSEYILRYHEALDKYVWVKKSNNKSFVRTWSDRTGDLEAEEVK